MMWLSSIIGWASVAGGFGLYLAYFLPAGNAWVCKGVIALLVTGLSVINFFGVKPGARTINFFTIGKLLSLLIFVGVGLLFIKGRNLTALHLSGRFNDAVIIALYAYSGFEYTVVPAGDATPPKGRPAGTLLGINVRYPLVCGNSDRCDGRLPRTCCVREAIGGRRPTFYGCGGRHYYRHRGAALHRWRQCRHSADQPAQPVRIGVR